MASLTPPVSSECENTEDPSTGYKKYTVYLDTFMKATSAEQDEAFDRHIEWVSNELKSDKQCQIFPRRFKISYDAVLSPESLAKIRERKDVRRVIEVTPHEKSELY